MSDDSTKKYHGGLIQTRNYDAITWRIPNVSLIPHEVDYVVQSPPFTFDGASFILKMYPYGQTERESEGYIDLILERLHSETDKQNIFIEIFCADVFGKKVETINKSYAHYFFVSEICTQFRKLNFMQNLKDSPEKWRIAPNDTFTLICALGKEESDLRRIRSEEDFQTISIQQNEGNRIRTSRNYGNREVGEIFKEYSHFKYFFFKIYDIASPVPDGYQIREQFMFANAVWILKIYPYFRMENSNKPSFDMVLVRLQTEIPEHHVLLEIVMPISKEQIVEKSFFFSPHQSEMEVISFQLKDEYPAFRNGYPEPRFLAFDINMRSKKNTGHESDLHSKLTKQVIGDGSSVILQTSKVLQDYKRLFLQHEDSDVIIKVKGQEFPAHRLILKSRSSVLASAFRYDMKEKSTGIVDIEDCEPSIFSQFLHFLYCGELESFSEDNAFELFAVADKYDVPDLRAMCMEFMIENLSVDTFSDIISLAVKHSEAELIELCTDFFARNLQKILLTVKWQSFITENPIQGNELMIKALVTDNSLSSRDPDRQTQRERQTHRGDPQKQTQQDRDQQRRMLENRDQQRRMLEDREQQRRMLEDKDTLRRTLEDRDQQRRMLEDRDTQRERYLWRQTIRNAEEFSIGGSCENKSCSIV